jgi:membrane-associated phospholipid phosphatase
MIRANSNRTRVRLMAVEIILLIYLSITGILIITFNHKLEHKTIHLCFRLIVVLIITLFSIIDSKSIIKRYIKFFRLLFPFVVLVYIYHETDYLNNLLFVHNLDPIFSRLEFLIFHTQPSLIFSTAFSSNLFAELMYIGYFAYYLMVAFIPIYIYFFISRYLAERSVFVIITSFSIYYIIFIAIPVVGPQFYFKNQLAQLPHGYIIGPVLRYLQSYGEAPTAAFPSSHVSICIMLLWICFKNAKKLLYLNLPVSVLLLFSTVYIRAHYVIDVAAGIILTPVVYALSMKLFSVLTKKLNNKDAYILSNEYTNQRSQKSA